jgi:hypothetical protein
MLKQVQAKRIESESTEFQVSVLNIEDCVKIYDESDKEITFLEYDRLDAQGQTDALLDGDYKKVKIKNVCENLTLKLRACYIMKMKEAKVWRVIRKPSCRHRI